RPATLLLPPPRRPQRTHGDRGLDRPVAGGMTPTLFQSLLGASFYSLAPAVRALHDVRGRARYAGRATIARGRNPLGRLCAAVAGLPKAREDVPTTVDFDARPDGETWRRDFGGQRMRSRLRRDGRLLVERLGPLRFRFALHVQD